MLKGGLTAMPKYCLRIWDRKTGKTRNATVSIESTLEALLAGLHFKGKPLFAKSASQKPAKRRFCVTITDIDTGHSAKNDIELGGEK